MAHYNQQDADEFIPCPYNKFEMITVRRMPRHLIRCPHRNEREYETCPYNAIHIIPRTDYRQHITTCPARVVAEKTINYELEKQSENFGRVKIKGCTDIPEYNTYNIKCSENWDDDDVKDVKPNFFQVPPNMVPDDISEKSEMDSGIDVQDLSEVEFNDPEERRSTRTHHGRDRRQNMPVRKPKQAPSVFQYSLKMAGVKQGHLLPGQAAPQNIQDSGNAESLASEAFEDETLDSKQPDARSKGSYEALMLSGYQIHQNNSGMVQSLTKEVYGGKMFDSKALDMEPKFIRGSQDVRSKVKHETQDVRPKVKHETQDVRPKVKREVPDVRPKVKREVPDVRPKVKREVPDQSVRPKVRQGLDKDSGNHLSSRPNSSACSKMSTNYEIDASVNVQSKVSLTQSKDIISDLDISAQGTHLDQDISLPEPFGNLGLSEEQPKIPFSQPSPGAGRGAILQYLLLNKGQNTSPKGPCPKPQALSSNGPLSPAQSIGRGTLAQYILGKNPTESSMASRPSLTNSGVSPQGLGRGMLAQIIKNRKIPVNTQPKDNLTTVSSQEHNQVSDNSESKRTTPQILDQEMFVNDFENSKPKGTSSKGSSNELGQEMLAQILNDDKVPANSESEETTKSQSQVLVRGMVTQISEERSPEPKERATTSAPQILGHGIYGGIPHSRVPANPESKFPRVEQSDDEDDLIPKFEGLGRGARLKNGNQDPRLYPPALGSIWSNKNFEYAKN